MPLVNTLALKDGLVKGGMPGRQATAIANVFAEADTSQIATKADLEALRAEMRAEISRKAIQLENLRGEIKTLRWMGGVVLTVLLGLLWRLFFAGGTIQGTGGG